MADASLRDIISDRLQERLRKLGIPPTDLSDDLDLVRSGVLDSLGFVDLIAGLESDTGKQVDLEHALDRKNATTLGGVISMFEQA